MNEVRVCEHCGHANEIAFLECEVCGSDLSVVIPSSLQEKTSETWYLTTASGERFDINNEMILGRMDSPCSSLLNTSDYVSRHHAKLLLTTQGLQIVDTSANGTEVNGKQIAKDEPYCLHDGDRLVLGGILIEVHHAS